MKIKYLVVSVILLVAVFGFSGTAKAVLSVQDLQAQIQALLQQIETLQAQLKEMQAQSSEAKWCYNFTKNLKIEDEGKDVEALWTALNKEFPGDVLNISYDHEGMGQPKRFGEYTAGAVSEFQEKYADDILKPSGLKRGTGYVGPATRKKLNALYGCSVACTQEVKQCPDGSYVSRTGIDCQFAKCPVGKEITEQVKCIFGNNNSGALQKCYTAENNSRAACSGAETCVADISGQKGEKITWKSSCGGYAYTTIDGESEYANFDCSKTQPSITVTSPNGGENFPYGNTMQIPVSWTTKNLPVGAGVQVRVLDNNSKQFFRSAVLTGVSSYKIGLLPIGKYIIRTEICTIGISDEAGPTCVAILATDDSDNYFTIASVATQPSITVTSPNGGESFATGQNIVVAWLASGLDNSRQYKAEIYMGIPNNNDAGSGFYLAKPCYTPYSSSNQCKDVVVVNGINNYTLTIPSNIYRTSGDYKITVKIIDWTAFISGVGEGIKVVATDDSDRLIKITSASTQPSITVTSPNGGELWKAGETKTITWASSGYTSGDVFISLVENIGGITAPCIYQIATLYSNTGTYNWVVPADITNIGPSMCGGTNLVGKQFKIRVSFGNAIDDSDNYFSITQ